MNKKMFIQLFKPFLAGIMLLTLVISFTTVVSAAEVKQVVLKSKLCPTPTLGNSHRPGNISHG